MLPVNVCGDPGPLAPCACTVVLANGKANAADTVVASRSLRITIPCKVEKVTTNSRAIRFMPIRTAHHPVATIRADRLVHTFNAATPKITWGIGFMYGLPTGDTHPVHFSIVSIRRQNEISSGPEMPPHETPLSLSGHPTQMERTLALDESDHLRHRILRRDRYQHMHLIHQQAAFLDSPFLLLGQLPEKPTRNDSSIPSTTSFVGAAA